jgi:exonuclease SbcC
MRPVRLELEGFTAFREPTVVDFEGADLFAFTGPTGAGKSSLVDAIVFALYGSVPRYDDRRLVAAAISQGSAEARVRLDFTVDGRRYSAVRVVRRTKTGASTREARLEGDGGRVVAGNERELAAEVEELLGLTYDHFCKCVVLPQGRFADFLHDRPEARQELLVELLDFGVYRQMGQLARQRAGEAKVRLEAFEARLAALAWATPEARSAGAARVDALRSLLADTEVEQPRLEELTRRIESLTAAAETAHARSQLLAEIELPAGLGELAATVAAADDELAEARRVELESEERTSAAERALTALPRRSEIDEVVRRWQLHDGHLEQQAKGERLLAERRGHEDAARVAHDRAKAAAATADDALERALRTHRAHAVAADLVAGEPCPVCRQLVATLPALELPADLDTARRTVDEMRRAVDAADTQHRAAERERQRIDDKLSTIAGELAALADQLEGAVDLETARRQLDDVATAEKALELARRDEQAARTRARRADERLAQLRKDEAGARAAFDKVRDRISTPDAAPPERTGELAADWQVLVDWAGAEAARQNLAAETARREATKAETERAGVLAALAERCAALDITLAGRPLRDAVVEALVRSESELTKIDEAMAEAGRVRADATELGTRAAVANELGRHLSAGGFERWLLDEALLVLVQGATEILRDLTHGQYSLALDSRTRNFTVVDHHNADQARSARTLSGGETFLASLALALSLADQLALLAAKGTARLDSIFLDEGFGSLDSATLDVVASAIEELGAQGRMVGIITHVAELAERVPLRFVVSKTAAGASVDRVEV